MREGGFYAGGIKPLLAFWGHFSTEPPSSSNPPFFCPFFNIITVILLKNGPKKRGLHLEGDFVKKWAVKYML